MARKQEIGTELKDLKEKIQDGKVIVGIDRVMKGIRDKSVKKVFLAANCPKKISDDVTHYTGLVNIPMIKLNLDNEELGLFCKKNFFVTVLGTLEE